MIAGKAVDLARLRDELAAAGLITGNLRNAEGDIREVSATGGVTDLPAGARAVIDAHVGPDTTAVALTAAQAKLKQRYNVAKTRLDAIVTAGPNYTAGEVRTAVVDLADLLRDMLALLKATAT